MTKWAVFRQEKMFFSQGSLCSVINFKPEKYSNTEKVTQFLTLTYFNFYAKTPATINFTYLKRHRSIQMFSVSVLDFFF